MREAINTHGEEIYEWFRRTIASQREDINWRSWRNLRFRGIKETCIKYRVTKYDVSRYESVFLRHLYRSLGRGGRMFLKFAQFFFFSFPLILETNFPLYLAISLSPLRITDSPLTCVARTCAHARLRQIDDYCQERTVNGWKCGKFVVLEFSASR